MSVSPERKILDAYNDAWNDHDPDAVVGQFAPRGTYSNPTTDGPLRGLAIRDYAAGALAGFPDVGFDVYRILETDDAAGHTLAMEWRMYGTHTGSFLGLPPTGKSIDLDGATVLDISPEGITDAVAYFDSRTFAEQLGLTFPAVLVQLPALAVGFLRQRL